MDEQKKKLLDILYKCIDESNKVLIQTTLNPSSEWNPNTTFNFSISNSMHEYKISVASSYVQCHIYFRKLYSFSVGIEIFTCLKDSHIEKGVLFFSRKNITLRPKENDNTIEQLLYKIEDKHGQPCHKRYGIT